eukprot:s1478_g7.t1
MASLCLQRLVLLSILVNEVCAAKRGRNAQAMPEERSMTGKDVREATKLLESTCPFPSESMAKNAPCSWQFAGALARATSLDQSCVFVHLLIMLSLVLNAVQVRFGGILGKFPNLVMLQHGEPGDGKSIALWLVLQVLYYFDSIKTKHDAAKHRADLRRYEEAKKAFEAASSVHDPELELEEPAPPSKPEKRDSVQNKGTFYGVSFALSDESPSWLVEKIEMRYAMRLGCLLEKQGGRAFLALHEGKSWLAEAFEQQKGGGLEDLNQILDHDIYKNNPATGQSRFHVRNPHVVGAVLLHLEELVDIAKKGDSVAGMPRFLIGHFLSVCSKVAPEGLSSQEMQNLLVEDPHYFNDLSYDEVVTAATNVLLLADSVFPYHRRRDDEVGPAAGRFSEIRGIHTMEFAAGVVSSFQKDFNDMVDDYRKAKKASDGKASLLSKDKTRPLQFIPGIHVFEQGLLRLLSVAGVEANQRQSLSAEDLVRKVATINPDTFLTNFNPSSVPPEASQQSVDAAFSLSRWFQAVYQFSTNAPQKVADFRRERIFKMDIPQPSAKAFAEKLQKAAC